MISKLRVLTIVFSDSWGGLEMVACKIAQEFTDMGHDVTMVSPAGSQIDTFCSGQNITHISMTPVFKYLDIVTAWKLAGIIKKKEIDIVHIYISKDLSTGCLAKTIAHRGKLVFSQHMDSHFPKKDLFHRWVFHKTDMITTVTKSVRKHVLEYTPVSHSSVHCIYNGVDVTKFNPNVKKADRAEYLIPEDALIVGLFGRLDRLKRQELLIEAAPKILESFPDTCFLIIGEESRSKTGTGYKEKLIQKINQKNLNDKFRIIDFTPEVQSFFALFDVAVLTTPKETFGIVIIEAMAMGIAVIATNAGGVPEIIDDNVSGLLFEPEDVGGLSEKIVSVLANKKIRESMGKAGIKKVHSHFDLKKKIAEYERLFYKLLEPEIR